MMNEERAPMELTDEEWVGDVTRRQLLGRGAVFGAALTLGPVLAACGGGDGDENEDETEPRPGGRLRLGYRNDDPNNDFNPVISNSNMALARVMQVYEPLAHYDSEGQVINWLAEEITPNNAVDEWTVRVPQGIEFHNGKTLTADDIIYTFLFHFDPDSGSVSTQVLDDIDPKRLMKMDERTVRFQLKRPNAFFNQVLSLWNLGIFPEGTKRFGEVGAIGTGPFKLESIAPNGDRVVLEKHANYRETKRPYVDTLEIVSIDDAQARVNALLSGQVEVISDVPPAQISAVENDDGVTLANVESGRWNGQVMATESPVFSDPRVRQAMKLLVDREQIRDNVFAGQAKIANDIFGWTDPSYPQDIEQRTYDPEQAKSLLASAGVENLAVDLNTGDLVQGLLNMSTLIAEQASAGSVNVEVQDRTADDFFTKRYMQTPFFSTYWSGGPYYLTAVRTLVAGSPLNEGAWEDAEFQSAFEGAKAASDPERANQLLQESQHVAHDGGPYIIPVFPNFLDAHSNNVQGLQEGPTFNLGFFNFREANIRT